MIETEMNAAAEEFIIELKSLGGHCKIKELKAWSKWKDDGWVKISVFLQQKYAKIDNSYLILTDAGREFESFQKEKEKELNKGKRSELEFEKLGYDTSNAKRMYKTYGSTRIMAIASVAISLFLLFLKLAEALKLWPYSK